MWTWGFDRQQTRGRMVAVGGLLATGLSVATMGCGLSPDYVTESKAAVLLIVASINGGVVLDSEVRYGTLSETGAFVCEDEVPVAVAVRNKNPGVPAPIIPSHVLITGYEVRYYRSDGRSAEGIDVPYRITGNLSTEVDVATSGTSDVIIEVVRRQAKLEPPLSNIEQSTILTAFAEVTIYGETISGDRVQGSGRLQIDFADYLDKETSCPSN